LTVLDMQNHESIGRHILGCGGGGWCWSSTDLYPAALLLGLFACLYLVVEWITGIVAERARLVFL